MSCKYLRIINGLLKLVILISCLFSPKRIWEEIWSSNTVNMVTHSIHLHTDLHFLSGSVAAH